MSKKPSQNLPLTRLDDLFSDLAADPAVPAAVDTPAPEAEQALSGWTWECDAEGHYTACSPEIEAALGFPPQHFTGQPLKSFCLAGHSAEALAAALQAGSLPVTVQVDFIAAHGRQLPANLHILAVQPASEGNGRPHGLHGFVQILADAPGLQALKQETSKPPAPTPAASDSPTTPIRQPAARKASSELPTVPRPRAPRPPEPSRPPTPAWNQAFGVRDDEHGSRPLASLDQLSAAGKESLRRGQPVLQDAKPGQPAALALPTSVESGSVNLLLEILDDDPSRTWTNEERMLVEQVTDQLTLALENARLFQQNVELLQEVEIDRQRYSDLYNRAPDCYFSLDAGGSFIEFNHTGLSWLGYTRAEVVGARHIPDILAPYSRSLFSEQMQRLIAEGRADNIEVDFLRKDGSTFPVLVDATAIYDEHGIFQQGRAIARDITRLRQLELRQRQLARAIEATAEMVVITDRDGSIVFANPAAEQITGYSREELIGENPRILKSGRQDNRFYEEMWSSILSGMAWRGDVVNRRKDGSLYTAQLTISPIANERGDATQFVAVQRDITAQRQAESEREKLLAETETLYNASAELNAARSYEDILSTLRRYSLVGRGAHHVALAVFDRPWTPAAMPERVDVAARWTTDAQASFDQQYTLTEFPSVARLLRPDAALVVEDIANDARLDERARALYLQKFHAASTIFVPLLAGGRWFGFVNANFPKITQFEEAAIRQIMSLAGQAAAAFQNIRLLEETRVRNEELSTINTIIGTASRSLDLAGMLNDVLEQLLSTISYNAGLISVTDTASQSLRLIASRNLPPALESRLISGGLDGTLCDLVFRRGQPVHIANFHEGAPLDVSSLITMGLLSYLGVPIETKGKILGTVCLFGSQPQGELPPHLGLVQSVGQQLGVAIENATLFEQTQTALASTETLYKASAELNTSLSYADILQVLRRYTALGMQTRYVVISLFDRPWEGDQRPEWLQPIAQWSAGEDGPNLQRLPLTTFSSAHHLFKPGEAVVVQDPADDPRLDTNARQIFLDYFQARSLLFAPVVVAGQWIGHVIGVYHQPVRFNEGDLRRLMTLAGQAAAAIQNIRLLEESRRRAEQLQTAAEIARDTSGTLALDALLDRAVHLIRARFDYYHVSIFLLDEGGKQAVVRASTGEAGAEMKRRGHQLAVGSRSIIGSVTQKGESLLSNDVLQDALHRPNPLLPHTRAELGIPLKIGERVIGALDVQSTEANAFKSDDLSVLQILADQIAVAVDNARAYELSQNAVDEMRKADQLKSQFLANMSHELRTPLNSIIGFSRVILKGIDGPISELQQQDLSAIYNSGQHLLNLINDILDLSKIEAGKMELSVEDNVNIADIINSVMSTVTGLIKDKPIQIQKEIAADLPVVRADPLKVRQVLINLLSNAAKFTEQGTITIQAGPQTGASGRQEVRVSVIDTGPGIAAEDQLKLFQPFSQVDGSPTRKTGGTGLGLSISRRLVEMHGGSIGLDSESGHGSKFYFTIPVNGPHAHPGKGTGGLDPGAPLVLAVDDEHQILNLYERYLHTHGYRVVGISDPALAVETARRMHPYAITLDVMMPGKDGWTVLRELRSDPVTREVPVILCTILEDQGKGFSLGATDYLMKPILEDDLVQALQRLSREGGVVEVLVANNDPSFRRMAQKMALDHPEYRLILTDGGADALTTLRTRQPNILLLDLNLPDLDGFTLLESVRADPAYAELPVILFTTNELSEEQRARLDSFSQVMMNKALIPEDELFRSIEATLARFNHPA